MPVSIVTNEDCMDMMKRYPDKFFDLAIVDPPYGIGGDKGVQKNNGKWGYKKHRHTDWDSKTPDEKYFDELFRVSKNQIVWGGNYYSEFLPPRMGWVSWYKGQVDFSFSDFEFPGKHYSLNDGRIHPTQKPQALYAWLLKNYAKPGDKILDTHLGSGSNRIAAYKLGFDFYGCDLDKDYFDAQDKRFKKAINEPLFQSRPDPEQKQLFE